MLGGGLLLLVTIGAYRLKSSALDRRLFGIALGVGTLLECVGVVKLLERPRGKDAVRPEVALLAKMKKGNGAGMQVEICRTSLLRLGPGMDPLLSALSDRGHSAVVKECLNRCQDCKSGALMATVDGIPMSAKDPQALLSDLDELS
jgi:hypothetical protein